MNNAYKISVRFVDEGSSVVVICKHLTFLSISYKYLAQLEPNSISVTWIHVVLNILQDFHFIWKFKICDGIILGRYVPYMALCCFRNPRWLPPQCKLKKKEPYWKNI